MKIIFLCSSLEPGKDGVGDYSRKLAASLLKSGNLPVIVALNDKYLLQEEVKETQYDDDMNIPVIRYSWSLSWKEKIKKIQDIINDFHPDWMSFQYVSYGFDKKGLPFYLPQTLQKLSGRFKWHIMFHETWAGTSNIVPFTHKVYGYFQKRIAIKLVKAIRPQKITTTNILYQLVLQEKNINASCLPLFSNISVQQPEVDYLLSIEKEYSITLNNKDFYKIGMFGTLYPEANLSEVIPVFLNNNKRNKTTVILIFGRNNRPEEVDKLEKNLSETVTVVRLGELSEVQVSTIMSILDDAILCTPFEYIGKSGAYAAFKLHKVNIETLSSAPIPKYEKEILKYNDYLSVRPAEKWDVTYVSNEFISLLNS